MIRSTLFRSVAPALRDSLNDAEVGALGMWLLMSAGAYPRGIAMCAKGGAGTDELEAAATARYTYPEGTPQEELMTRGMTNPEYRLPTASRMTAANAIAGLEDLMYTIATSNEERDNPQRDAPPQEDRIVGREARANPIPRFDAAPEGAGVPEWQVNQFLGRTRAPTPQENMTVVRDMRVNIPRFTADREPVFAPMEELARADEAAHPEQMRQANEWVLANRQQIAREREQARIDELANRTRGIPNRR